MVRLAAGLALVFGIVSLVGGVQGYVAKKSVASLIAGGASGILLLVAAWFAFQDKSWAVLAVLVVSVALAVRFLPTFLKDTSNLWPALVMAALGLLTAVVSVIALFPSRSG